MSLTPRQQPREPTYAQRRQAELIDAKAADLLAAIRQSLADRTEGGEIASRIAWAVEMAKAALLAGVLLVIGAAPPGADPASPLAAWWQGARTAAGTLCCGVADGSLVRARQAGTGWQALIGETWRDMPPGAIVEGYAPHPSGSAAVWLWAGEIRCFVQPVAGG